MLPLSAMWLFQTAVWLMKVRVNFGLRVREGRAWVMGGHIIFGVQVQETVTWSTLAEICDLLCGRVPPCMLQGH